MLLLIFDFDYACVHCVQFEIISCQIQLEHIQMEFKLFYLIVDSNKQTIHFIS